MAKQVNSSRLEEIDFSRFNLRDAYITDQAEYVAALRDEALFSNYGITVMVRIPSIDSNYLFENNVDEYSNFVDITWMDTTETVIPLFKEYRQNVSEDGMTADGTTGIYSLDVILPTKLHLPKNSRIIFNEYNSREEKIAREWVVLSTEMKQISNSKTYSRIAHCVPARKETWNNSDTPISTIWFDYKVPEKEKIIKERLAAQGIIWFIKAGIDASKVRHTIVDTIDENIIIDPEYNESTNVLYYYDTRDINIIEPGVGLEIDNNYTLTDEEGNVILIQTEENGLKDIPLILTVKDIDYETGALKEYTLNLRKGYTDFGEDGKIVSFGPIDNYKAKIKLASGPWNGDIYHEEIYDKVEIENPKYIVPKQLDAVFISKKIAVSVLN